MKLKFTQLVLLVCFVCCAILAQAQTTINGSVKDENGEAVIGAAVYETNTSRGTITDVNGNYSLNVDQLPTSITISYVGFKTIKIDVMDGVTPINIIMVENTSRLDDVVVVGTRGKARTILTSAVPIDNLNPADLVRSGQNTIDQMINYRVPSYNSTNQTISDATAHFDPSELRNLGPSRTLVLVNGKRKNQSALVYVNDTPGKGEVGVDMKSIPTAAIKRIEVLRDGAAAQYGSDAVAGVINIVLKDQASDWNVSAGAGITTMGDGLTYDASINKGFKIGKGTLNLTADYYHQDYTDRSGVPGGDGLFGVIFQPSQAALDNGEITQAEFDAQQEFANSILNGTHPWIQENPDLGMIVGQPEYSKISALANFDLPYKDGVGTFYSTFGYTARNGTSFALYRAPYWITDDSGLLTPEGEEYQGFQPTFETSIGDLTFIIGNRYNFNGWKSDLSFTSGSNSVDYLIGNTINPSLLPNSPTEFDAGAYTFGHNLLNLDVSKSFGDITLMLGAEARQESFDVVAGQEESYVNGGAQSFPGLQPGNAVEATRTNAGVYAGLDWDITEKFLLGGAARFENYSDFGSNLSWKVNSRYILGDNKGAVRASVSTGFRAPSLHQIHLSNVQTLVSGGTVSNQGTFANTSDVIRGLGVPELTAETSFNFTGGITYKLAKGLSLTADYYNINVDNRVLFTGEVGFDGDDSTINDVEQVLLDNDVTSIKFFVNAMDTRTQGIDVVLDYTGFRFGNDNKVGFTVAVNNNRTQIIGDINAPETLAEAGYDIFSRKEQSRVTTARPNFKSLVGINAKFSNFTATLNNTYFGKVTWQHATDPNLDQTFSGKLITDLILGYDVTESFGLQLKVNNLFNVYPDVIVTGGDFVTDLGGRFQYPWEVNQFGFNGTMVSLRANISF